MTSFHNTVSSHFKVLLLGFIFIIVSVHPVYSEANLDVEVLGVEGRLYSNILARLRIYLYSQNSSLNKEEIKRLHDKAEREIASALAPYGYYSAQINAKLEETETGWKASYTIQPGTPVRISNISLSVTGEGKDLPDFSDALDLLGITNGEILDQPLYEKGKKALNRKARSLGFLEATFTTHQINILEGRKKAEIELVMDTGQRYYFGKTTSDQEIIQEELLFRFLPYKEGTFFSGARLYELQRDLYRTGYFGRVVVEGGISDPDGKYIPVTIHVEPVEYYNNYSFGVGYATDTRFHTLFEWENALFNKRGHRVEASLLLGELDSHCTFNYKVPVADPRYNSMVYTTSWNREQWEGITTSLLTAGTAFDYKTPTTNYGMSLNVRDENYTVGSTKGKSLILMPLVYGSWAFADNIINTTNGFRASVSLGGATENIVSDVSFIKAQADGKLILSPIKDWRLIWRGSIGGIFVDSINNIPPSLRFYAGGAKSVRGYDYRTLGPVDASGELVGGTFLLTGSVEVERSLNDYLRLFGFYDVGNAMDDLNVELVSGVGGGLSVIMPFGHIRVELAYPLNNEGDSQYFYLSVGADL